MVASILSSILESKISIVFAYCIFGFVGGLILSFSMFGFAVGSTVVSKFLIFDLSEFSCSLSSSVVVF